MMMRRQLKDKPGRAIGSTAMAGQHGLGVGDQPQGGFPIAKEPGDLFLQRIRIAHLDGRLVREQRLGERGEIFHVRAEENGFAGKNGFNRILPAARGQALADKHDRRNGVPVLKLTGRIEKQACWRRGTSAARFAAQTNVEAEPFQPSPNFPGAFHMPGGDNQNESREIHSKALKNFAENFLFARMGASAEQNRAITIDSEAAKNFERQFRVQPDVRWIVLDAADMVNAIAGNSESSPPFDIFRFLDANGIETAKRWSDEKTKTLEACLGSVREAGVDKGERNPAMMGLGREVGPDLGFDQYNPDGTDGSKGATHDRPEVERAVENLHALTGFGVRDMEAGRRGGGKDEEEVGIELLEF
jgi:hypothetical protein